MRLLLITYIITFSCFDVFSSEWICDKQKSYAEGSEFYSCGSGIAKNEEKACKKALQSAHEEFMYICENSYHCKGKEKIVKPGKIKVSPSKALSLLAPYTLTRIIEQVKAVVPLAAYLFLFQMLILRQAYV